jgi:hypothetical protein
VLQLALPVLLLSQDEPGLNEGRAAVSPDAAAVAPARFQLGWSQLRTRDVADGTVRSASGTALGIRLSRPVLPRVRLEGDIRLQVAGLRGPCTVTEAAREECSYKADAQSIGDVSISFGASVVPVRRVSISALVSPRLNTRAVDRAADMGHANWSAHPWSLAAGLDVALSRSTRLLLEYRRMGSTHFAPDPETRERIGAASREMRGDALTAMLSVPLATGVPAARGVFDDGSSHPAWTTFGLVVENDLPWRDEAYTNGLRAFVTEVPYVREALRLWHVGWQRDAVACPSGGETIAATTPFCRVTQVAVTQTMHTPVDIRRPELQPRDRPFAGTLFGSFRSDLLRPSEDGRELLALGSELQLGVLGPSAGSEETQSMAHWLISTGSARPAGWPNQLDNRLHAAWLGDVTYRGTGMSSVAPSAGWPRRLLNADVSLRANGVLGTTHRSASAGLVGRWGPGGRGLPLTTQRAVVPTKLVRIYQKAAPGGRDSVETEYRSTRALRYALVGTLDERLGEHNETLLGDGISRRRTLPEAGTGLQLEWGSAALTGIVVHRAREFAPRDVPISGYVRYWTAQFTYRPRMR